MSNILNIHIKPGLRFELQAFVFITTFIEAKLMTSYGQTNIENYRLSAHKILQNTMSVQKSYLLRQ